MGQGSTESFPQAGCQSCHKSEASMTAESAALAADPPKHNPSDAKCTELEMVATIREFNNA